MQSIIEKAKAIRLLILDIDGVLTDGVIHYGPQEEEIKSFHIHDGLGIQLLQQAGILVAVISGKKSMAATRRLKELAIEHIYLGHQDKVPAYEELKQKLRLKDNEVAYMGDDLPDLPLLRRAGLAITVPSAPDLIKQYIDLITKNKGGKGAVREACELILASQDRYQSVVESYLTK
jgi:3-deoxy-D-manno-octulosonate 8-phosphate phosphatase (KDO 8-P phosphatase)